MCSYLIVHSHEIAPCRPPHGKQSRTRRRDAEAKPDIVVTAECGEHGSGEVLSIRRWHLLVINSDRQLPHLLRRVLVKVAIEETNDRILYSPRSLSSQLQHGDRLPAVAPCHPT